MSVSVSIVDGALKPVASGERDARAGAVVCFEGVVRPDEDGRTIEALHYQTYEPMVQTMLREIAADVLKKHGLVSITVDHSRGRVVVGEVSFRLIVEAGHRKPALAAMDEFIDRLKKDVPIWKRAVWAGESGGSR